VESKCGTHVESTRGTRYLSGSFNQYMKRAYVTAVGDENTCGAYMWRAVHMESNSCGERTLLPAYFQLCAEITLQHDTFK